MNRATLALLCASLICMVAGCGGGATTLDDETNGGTVVPDNGNSSGGGDNVNANDNAEENANENANDNSDDNTNDNSDDDGADSPPARLTVTSRLLLNDAGAIDQRFAYRPGCGGDNVSPQLSWTGAPEETQSFVVVVLDRSAGDFIHWMVFDIAAGVTNINEGGPAPGGQTLNDYEQGLFGYGGPCPPSGEVHTYVFRVYALDIRNAGLTAGRQVSLAELEDLIADHVVGQGELTAPFTGP
ncbi:MAG: YbhB/YbcL family Raf kinase inhibitor-like protein [Phycisphaerae bacterium]|nr:YbhB/YbcL family Raf kinase inhibitor-like protein [Phycisphaerae bacterium]